MQDIQSNDSLKVAQPVIEQEGSLESTENINHAHAV